MDERRTRSDYAIRLERLADHLDDALDLRRMADLACVSDELAASTP